MIRTPRYGRRLDDFDVGEVYHHPWEVTVDEGMLAMFASSFQDATPTYASKLAAEGLGLRARPLHPLWLLNIGLSFSVQDVSERAIAHLAYIDVRFPAACYPGDTLTGRSRVLGKKPVSTQDKGVVHVLTQVLNQDDELVCCFERKVLVPAGRHRDRPNAIAPVETSPMQMGEIARAPASVLERARTGSWPPHRAGFPGFWEDLEVGDIIIHDRGRTVSEAEHMQLTTLCRNSHPLHFDEHYCEARSFARTRVVFGGLVLSWVLALSSRDTAGNALWDLGLDDGAHPSGVIGGDTLFAASKVLAKKAYSEHAGEVTLRVVGLKNTSARPLLDAGDDLFTPELGRTDHKVKEKVVEVTRRLLLRRRGAEAC